jgi:xanthosine utilization system XapX-like protein
MNAESAKAAEKTLNTKLNHIYEIEKEKPKNPIIKIVGITGILINDSTVNRIEKDINGRNFSNCNKKRRIVHYYKNERNGSCTVIMEVTSELHKKIKDNGNRIFLAHLCCRVYDVINVKPCFNCGRVGHSANKCPNKVVCLKCAGEHKTSTCDSTNSDKCVNCCFSNNTYHTKYKTDHVAVDTMQCEILKAKIRKFMETTSYEVNPTVPRFLGKVGNYKKKQPEVKRTTNLMTLKTFNESRESLASSTRGSVSDLTEILAPGT